MKKQCSRCGKMMPLTKENFTYLISRHQWVARCRECCRQIGKENYWKDPEKGRAKTHLWHLKNVELHRRLAREYGRRIRQELLTAYGACCMCCGETALPFLTLEHINHDGATHRREVGESSNVYRDLKRRGWPREGYAILCMNCNFATRFGDPCPHKRVAGPPPGVPVQ